MKKKFSIGTALIHLFFIVTCLTFIIPMIYVLSISFSSEKAISDFGYSLIPKVWSLDAYKHIFRNPDQVIYSYQTTIIYSLVGSFASL